MNEREHNMSNQADWDGNYTSWALAFAFALILGALLLGLVGCQPPLPGGTPLPPKAMCNYDVGTCFATAVCEPARWEYHACGNGTAACTWDDGSGHPLGVSNCLPAPGLVCIGRECATLPKCPAVNFTTCRDDAGTFVRDKGTCTDSVSGAVVAGCMVDIPGNGESWVGTCVAVCQ